MAGEDRADRRKALLKAVLEIPVILVVSFALVFGFVRPVVAAPFHIPTESMVPTLKVEDRLLVNKFIYRFTEPERGDVALFENQQGEKDPLIKRVVGLPGEELELRDGKVYVNGEPLEEPYLERDPCKPGYPKTCSFGPVNLPRNHYFMMGDNRTNSLDSRFFGPVPEDDVIGEALVRFWPPGRVAAGGALRPDGLRLSARRFVPRQHVPFGDFQHAALRRLSASRPYALRFVLLESPCAAQSGL